MMMIVMMCRLLPYFLEQRLLQILFMPDDFQELSSRQCLNRRCNQICLWIHFPNNGNGFLHLLLFRNVRSGQNHGRRKANLVIKKLAKVLVIQFCLRGIHNGYGTVQMYRKIRGNRLYRGKNIGKLSDAGRLYQNTVGLILFNHFFQRSLKIADQGTADTPLIHFSNLDTGILQKAAVNPDFSELIFNENHILSF